MASGRTVLVVDGNTPELITRWVEDGHAPASLTYGAVLEDLDPSLEIEVAIPSHPEFDPFDVELDHVIGVALTGASVTWSADAREAEPHREFLQRVFDFEIPVFGSCWGLHVATAVLGGALRASPKGAEFGVARTIALSEAGRRHPMFAGKPNAFDSICMHRDEIERPPEGAVILASNAHSDVQAMVYEQGPVRFWGVQYHPELGLDSIANRLDADAAFVYRDDSLFHDDADRHATADDFRRLADAPEDERALAWRYGVTEDVTHFDRRTLELANWVATLGPGR